MKKPRTLKEQVADYFGDRMDEIDALFNPSNPNYHYFKTPEQHALLGEFLECVPMPDKAWDNFPYDKIATGEIVFDEEEEHENPVDLIKKSGNYDPMDPPFPSPEREKRRLERIKKMHQSNEMVLPILRSQLDEIDNMSDEEIQKEAESIYFFGNEEDDGKMIEFSSDSTATPEQLQMMAKDHHEKDSLSPISEEELISLNRQPCQPPQGQNPNPYIYNRQSGQVEYQPSYYPQQPIGYQSPMMQDNSYTQQSQNYSRYPQFQNHHQPIQNQLQMTDELVKKYPYFQFRPVPLLAPNHSCTTTVSNSRGSYVLDEQLQMNNIPPLPQLRFSQMYGMITENFHKDNQTSLSINVDDYRYDEGVVGSFYRVALLRNCVDEDLKAQMRDMVYGPVTKVIEFAKKYTMGSGWALLTYWYENINTVLCRRYTELREWKRMYESFYPVPLEQDCVYRTYNELRLEMDSVARESYYDIYDYRLTEEEVRKGKGPEILENKLPEWGVLPPLPDKWACSEVNPGVYGITDPIKYYGLAFREFTCRADLNKKIVELEEQRKKCCEEIINYAKSIVDPENPKYSEFFEWVNDCYGFVPLYELAEKRKEIEEERIQKAFEEIDKNAQTYDPVTLSSGYDRKGVRRINPELKIYYRKNGHLILNGVTRVDPATLQPLDKNEKNPGLMEYTYKQDQENKKKAEYIDKLPYTMTNAQYEAFYEANPHLIPLTPTQRYAAEKTKRASETYNKEKDPDKQLEMYYQQEVLIPRLIEQRANSIGKSFSQYNWSGIFDNTGIDSSVKYSNSSQVFFTNNNLKNQLYKASQEFTAEELDQNEALNNVLDLDYQYKRDKFLSAVVLGNCKSKTGLFMGKKDAEPGQLKAEEIPRSINEQVNFNNAELFLPRDAKIPEERKYVESPLKHIPTGQQKSQSQSAECYQDEDIILDSPPQTKRLTLEEEAVQLADSILPPSGSLKRTITRCKLTDEEAQAIFDSPGGYITEEEIPIDQLTPEEREELIRDYEERRIGNGNG